MVKRDGDLSFYLRVKEKIVLFVFLYFLDLLFPLVAIILFFSGISIFEAQSFLLKGSVSRELTGVKISIIR